MRHNACAHHAHVWGLAQAVAERHGESPFLAPADCGASVQFGGGAAGEDEDDGMWSEDVPGT